MDNNGLIRKIDELKSIIDSRRPLSPQEIKELDDYYRIGTTYSSHRVDAAQTFLQRYRCGECRKRKQSCTR